MNGIYNTGVLNIGNSCYLNSAIQMLFNSNDFITICKGTIFENIINDYKNSNIFNPKEIKGIVAKNNKMFNNTNQQDSFEFIIYLFDTLDKILGSSKNYNNLLYNKFGIKLTTSIKCKMSNCNKDSNTHVTELFLELPITDELDLSASYRYYKSMTILQNDNAYYCDNCKKKVTARKSTITSKWPDNLIIVFKRFDYQMRKDNRSINIPLNWRHGYKLKGAIIHMGSFGGGHYIYFGYNNQNWFIANDSHISKIDDINSFINHQGKQSYIVYYERNNKNEWEQNTEL
jgi:ubiquitin carboxyl-terminal hydrolase 36/42